MGPSVENPDLVYQETGYSKSLTYSRPAECGSRQAIQARPDHSNRIVSPSRSLPSNLQQAAPASDRPFCSKVQLQTGSVGVTSTRPPGLGSQCTQFAMEVSGSICLPTGSHLGQSSGEAAVLVQENHSDCSRGAQHALVLGSIDYVISNPIVFTQPVEPTHPTIQLDSTQESVNILSNGQARPSLTLPTAISLLRFIIGLDNKKDAMTSRCLDRKEV